jgi:hypothetical protein
MKLTTEDVDFITARACDADATAYNVASRLSRQALTPNDMLRARGEVVDGEEGNIPM